MKRIVIIGSSSSGKTTLARKLSERLGMEHKELDYFFWEPNWRQANPEDFRSRVESFTAQEAWITDGNFSAVRDLVWRRATTIIWLDYPFHIIMKQFLKRSILRSVRKEELWNGNRETIWNSILKPNSLFIWIIRTYRKNRKRYSTLMESNEFKNAKFHRFKSSKETKQFVNGVCK